MAKGHKGRRLASTRLNLAGYLFLLAFFIIMLAIIVNSDSMATRPFSMIYVILGIVLSLVVWLVILFFWFLPSLMYFHEKGIVCGLVRGGLKSAKRKEGTPAPPLPPSGLIPYDEVEHVLLRIEREEDEDEVEERLRGTFVFRIDGHDFLYRARAVDIDRLDETLIDMLDEKYLGAVVQNVER